MDMFGPEWEARKQKAFEKLKREAEDIMRRVATKRPNLSEAEKRELLFATRVENITPASIQTNEDYTVLVPEDAC